jgi:hypothetical protein
MKKVIMTLEGETHPDVWVLAKGDDIKMITPDLLEISFYIERLIKEEEEKHFTKPVE